MILLKFIAAIVVAAIGKCANLSCFQDAGALVNGVLVLVDKSRWHPKWKDRLKLCRECPIYYKRLETCGSPLQRGKDYRMDNGKIMGCFCFMPVKARTECNCWLHDTTMKSMGWPEPLNDYE